jgi:hypothetical protein
MMRRTIEGRCGIKATVLADSINSAGIRLLGFEVEFPRIILAELNTHAMLSKNSHSSRAIPFAKMKEQLKGRPVRFGEANPGMQDKGSNHDALVRLYDNRDGEPYEEPPEAVWDIARQSAMEFSEAFFNAGYHKQVYNRLTEPFQMMKTVVSGTEWANFYWLRDHGAADPTLQELARVMREAMDASEPQFLHPGEWHLPYVEWIVQPNGEPSYKDVCGAWRASDWMSLVKMSAARSAAVSFRNVDYTMEKCLEVHDRLVGDDRKHGSAMEHQATPMLPEQFRDLGSGLVANVPAIPETWQEGISHMDREYNLWSGKFRGFIQYRKLIPGENYTGANQ